MKLFRLWFIALICLTTITSSSDAQPGAQKPAVALAQPANPDIQIDFGGVYQTVTYQNLYRRVYKNLAAGALVQYGYEPLFYAQFDASQSAHFQQLCVDVSLDPPSYQAAVMARLSQADPKSVSRIVTGGMVFSLGPLNDPTAAYTVPPITVLEGQPTPLVCFTTASKDPSIISTLASDSALKVTYAIPVVNTLSATCTITLVVANQSVFSNSINGPVTLAPPPGPGGPATVALTRNQMASAINQGYINLRQSCVDQSGAQTQTDLAQQAAAGLLPIVMGQMGVQQLPFADAMKQLANFSFNGADAGTTINSYLSDLSNTVHNTASGSVKVAGGTSANVIGLFSGAANGEIDTSHAEDSLNTSDAKIQWNGTQFIPASLNVFVLNSGANQQVASLSASQTTIVGNAQSSRSYLIPIAPLNTAPFTPMVPVGSVVPMFLTPTDIAALAPVWLPADGRTISDGMSPLNTQVLPDIRDRFILGTDAATDVSVTNNTNQNGTLSVNLPVVSNGGTSDPVQGGSRNNVGQGTWPYFVIDTSANEIEAYDHTHNIANLAGQAAGLTSFQPYRRLVYMVRCRP